MSHRHHGPGSFIQEALEISRIATKAAKRVRRCNHWITIFLHSLDNAGPSGGVREGTMYEHDGWLFCFSHFRHHSSSGSYPRCLLRAHTGSTSPCLIKATRLDLYHPQCRDESCGPGAATGFAVNRPDSRASQSSNRVVLTCESALGSSVRSLRWAP